MVARRAHYASAVKLDRRNYLIGILSVILGTIVGPAVFATLTDQANVAWLKTAAGITSLISTILVGIQTFRREGEKAEKHRACAGCHVLGLRPREV